MQIEEAIKEGEQWLSAHPHLTGLKLYVAIKLGIEALREVERLRRCHGCFAVNLLPGETKE